MASACTCEALQASIGVDFGATYSGIAITTFLACDVHPDECSRPRPFYADKIPTVLRRKPGSPYFGFSQESQMPNEDEDVLRYFKLALVAPEERRNPEDAGTQALLEKMLWDVNVEEQISELVSLYLQGLFDMVFQRLSLLPRFDRSACHVVVSWPALWDNNMSGSLDLLKQAVALAGISPASVKDVRYIKEHEAAVQCVLYYHGGELAELLKGQNSIIVADCGGITIDAATYYIQDSTTEPDVIRPLCQLTGAVILDVCFREKVVSKVSEVTGLQEETEFPADLKQSIQKTMSRWHHEIKHDFDPSRLGEGFTSFKIQDKHTIIITRDEMIGIFDKVIDQIVAVIRNLFISSLDEKTPECIILTGGLSINPHVQRTVRLRLERLLGPDHHPKFIMGGPNAWTAVAQGAAFSQSKPNSN